MWIARDMDGLIHMYEKRLIRTVYGWYSNGRIISGPSYDSPEVQWEDEKPKELI